MKTKRYSHSITYFKDILSPIVAANYTICIKGILMEQRLNVIKNNKVHNGHQQVG